MTTTVVYHSADMDGIFCREVAKKFLLANQKPGENIEFIGWNFGNNPLDDRLLAGKLIVMDLPLLTPFGLEFRSGWICRIGGDELQPIDRWDSSNIVWLDHHKTAIDVTPEIVPGYRIDGVAACRLAYQWFYHQSQGFDPHRNQLDPALPNKQAFIDRVVPEPLAIRLAGEYDIWDKRDPRAETLQYGLNLGEPDFEALLMTGQKNYTLKLIEQGATAQQYARKINADLVKYRSFFFDWEGIRWIVLNTGRFNSLTFEALDVPDSGHAGLMGFYFNGREWSFSLYHAKHRTDLDLSLIAKKHGGGGHRGACGFTWPGHVQLPFFDVAPQITLESKGQSDPSVEIPTPVATSTRPQAPAIVQGEATSQIDREGKTSVADPADSLASAEIEEGDLQS